MAKKSKKKKGKEMDPKEMEKLFGGHLDTDERKTYTTSSRVRRTL